MVRAVQSIRQHISASIVFIGSFLSRRTARFFLGLCAVFALLLPAAAYAWSHFGTAAASVMAKDQNSRNTTLRAEQAVPAKIDADPRSDTADQDASSEDASRPQAAGDAQVNAEVYINGNPVPLSPQGTVHEEISNQNGKTSVDISIQSSASGDSRSAASSSMNIDLNSSASTESERADGGQAFDD